MAGESVFVDTNLVVHSRNADAADHDAAKQLLLSLASSGAELWISRQVLREFAVVVSKQMMAKDAFDATALAAELDRLEAEFTVGNENDDTTRHWKRLLRTHQLSDLIRYQRGR